MDIWLFEQSRYLTVGLPGSIAHLLPLNMTINFKPVSILLVDDDAINNFISVKLIKKILINAVVKTHVDGKLAIDSLVETKANDAADMPGYILLDMNMPIMNGCAFLEEYTKLGIDPEGKIKIFIMSSSDYNSDIIKAKSYPAVKGFISKPLNIDKIKDILGYV